MKAQSHSSRIGAPDTHLDRRFLSKAPHQQRNQAFDLAMLAATRAIMLPIATAIALLAFTTPTTASPFDFHQKIIPPDGASNDNFGGSVALDGDYALIGSRFDDDNGIESGSAYLFDANSGEQLQKFLAPDGASNDWFGYSVALDGEYALIGSPFDDDNGLSSGSAYLFDVNSGELLQKFLDPDGITGGWFGSSVALDGDYALISAPTNSWGGSSGSAYLFDVNSGELLQKFLSAGRERFGWSIALDGNYVLIGSYLDDDNRIIHSGSAYLFDAISGNLLQKFLAPDRAVGDQFGYSVALDGDLALIGSLLDNAKGFNSGSVYLFDITSGNLLQKFLAPDGTSHDRFGRSVALDGNLALIGSFLSDYNWIDNGMDSGSAYLFDVTSGDLLQKFLAPDLAFNDRFGFSVALDGDSMLIGSYLDDDKGSDSGSAHLFAREEMEKVPEPSAILGLIAIGTLGVLKRFSGKQKQ